MEYVHLACVHIYLFFPKPSAQVDQIVHPRQLATCTSLHPSALPCTHRHRTYCDSPLVTVPHSHSHTAKSKAEWHGWQVCVLSHMPDLAPHTFNKSQWNNVLHGPSEFPVRAEAAAWASPPRCVKLSGLLVLSPAGWVSLHGLDVSLHMSDLVHQVSNLSSPLRGGSDAAPCLSMQPVRLNGAFVGCWDLWLILPVWWNI